MSRLPAGAGVREQGEEQGGLPWVMVCAGAAQDLTPPVSQGLISKSAGKAVSFQATAHNVGHLNAKVKADAP